MSQLKYGAQILIAADGLIYMGDSTGRYYWSLMTDEWHPVRLLDGCGVCDDEGELLRVYAKKCKTPPPTYTAPHVEVKPLPDEADRHLAAAVKAFEELKALFDRVVAQRDAAIAERDAARAELKQKEEGK